MKNHPAFLSGYNEKLIILQFFQRQNNDFVIFQQLTKNDDFANFQIANEKLIILQFFQRQTEK